MRALLTCVIFLWAVHTCFGQQSEKIIGISIVYRLPSCDDFCRIQLTANKDKKVMIETPGIDLVEETDRSLKRKLIKLKSTDWDRLLNSFYLDDIKLLPDISGCPGCDGEHAVVNLILVTDSITYRKAFEAQDPPKALKSLTQQMAKDLMKMEDIIR